MTAQTSIVMPTYNRLASLQRVVAALEAQTVGPGAFELIVTSDGSTDGTDEYLRSVQTSFRLHPIFQTNQGPAAARNRGIEKACAPIIIFLDDDVAPAPQFISEHLIAHGEYGDQVVVLGPMLTPPETYLSPWVRWEQAKLIEQYRAMEMGHWEPEARQFYTGNASIARRHLLSSGGFDESFRRAEDVELAYRLQQDNLKFIFRSTAVGYHFAERSYTSWLDTAYQYGCNDVRFAQEKEQAWLLPVVRQEYRGRNPLTRGLSRLCLDRPSLSGIAQELLERVAWLGNQFDQDSISSAVYSAIFNLNYYQGIGDSLGGRNIFFERSGKKDSVKFQIDDFGDSRKTIDT